MTEITVREITQQDREAWWELWQGCIEFYQTTQDESVSENTWQRFFDPNAPVYCRVAEHSDQGIVAFMIYMLHPDSWSTKTACYLEDLFTNSKYRKLGAGRALIESLIETGKKENWYQLYWMANKDNKTARSLYDQVAKETNWIRYEIDF